MLKKPNMERIQKSNPLCVFGHGEEKALSPIKFKKRKIKIKQGDGSNLVSHSPSQQSIAESPIHESMMRVKVESELKELPGQNEAFAGKPVLQKHYH